MEEKEVKECGMYDTAKSPWFGGFGASWDV